jgi:hypothetical protein
MSLRRPVRVVTPFDIWGYPIRTLSNIIFKHYQFIDPTLRSRTTSSFVTYNSFTITAPSDRMIWVLGVRFYREMYRRGGGEAQSHLLFDNNPAGAGAGTSSDSPVPVISHFYAGFIIPPGSSMTVTIQYRNSQGYTVNMQNVVVDILYAEVVVA